MIDQLRIRQLRLLIEVAEQSSILHAARKLNFSQPAATKALQQLEDIFGAKLIERSKQGSKLTLSGKLLYERAKKILNTAYTVEQELLELKTGKMGRVVVGVLPVALPVLLPASLTRLHSEYPGIIIQVVSGDSGFLLEMLEIEKIDLLIGRTWLGEDSAIKSLTLFRSSFSLIARNAHPIFRERSQTLDAARKYSWVMPPVGSHGRAAIDTALTAHGGTPPRCSVETTSYVITKELLRSSDMIALVDKAAFIKDVHNGVLRIIDSNFENILPPIGIMSLRRRDFTPVEERVVTCITQAATELQYSKV